jgi:hypothetical protein
MEVFRIQKSIDQKEVGKYPQVTTAEYPISVRDPIFTGNIYFTKVDRYVAPRPILERRAKVTDLVSSPVMGTGFRLLISDRLKSILEPYNESDFQFFETSLIVKGDQKLDYWIINAFHFRMDYISLAHSDLDIERKGMHEVIKIASQSELLDIIEKEKAELNSCTLNNIAFLSEKIQYHFFALRYVEGGIGYYVSDLVKKELENAKCTGIRFEEQRLI